MFLLFENPHNSIQTSILLISPQLLFIYMYKSFQTYVFKSINLIMNYRFKEYQRSTMYGVQASLQVDI